VNLVDTADALGVSPDGSVVFVTGGSIPAAIGFYNYATVAYDAATGAELWVGRYTNSGDDYAKALVVSPDGSTVFVTGTSSGSMSGRDYATVAYDTASGGQVWARRYNGPGDASDEAYALAVSPDGSAVFVTGASFGSSSGFDYATLAYSAV
jgi:DNA-binding beta-propeller fold protein YncE